LLVCSDDNKLASTIPDDSRTTIEKALQQTLLHPLKHLLETASISATQQTQICNGYKFTVEALLARTSIGGIDRMR
jgi:hypothetical protein